MADREPGVKRATVCPSCGARVAPRAKFCSNCGASLAHPPGLPSPPSKSVAGGEGERRPVTILFTDVAGSTAISERLDPEEWRKVVSGAHRRVSDAVVRYEGTIAQLLGDGVLAFFGAPVAHEDDPARAVHAALDIQTSIAAYARDLRGYVDDFAVRIGIHTGKVVVGKIGSPEHSEYLAVGFPVNLAARLQSAAAPGKVLLSGSTARLVRGSFELTSLGEISVKGKAAPVAVFEVVRPLAVPARTRGLAAFRSPLVGREAELAVLTRALAGLCQGHGGIVTLLGEAGIGKSRLVEEAHAWAERNLSQPPHWLEGRALSYGAALPYWTITQLLKADLGLSDGDPEMQARAALRGRLDALLGVEALEVYPYLAHLLGLKLEGEHAGRLAALDSETLRHQVLVCVWRHTEALAAGKPLVLVCEDIHWADPSTLDALGELLPLTDHVPLLLLLVGRAERQHGSWRLKVRAETEYAQRYAEIMLRPLEESDSAQLVHNLLAASDGRGEVTSPLRRLLLDRAEGNPFYLEELVASLVERGILAREGDAWQLKGPIESLSIPDTVQGVILARLDRLEEDVRGTLQMASVIGRSFLYRLLAAIAEAERQIDRHLMVLQRADLVREKAVRPELEYIFKHSLAQETAYDSLLLERRREFHRRVGEALERLFADRREEFYGLLAHHFDLAKEGERAVHYLIAAGDKARMEDALAEAAGFYRRAVERLETAGDAEAAARTWLKLALVRQADFDFAAAHDAYESAFAWQQQAPRWARRSPDEGAVLRRSTHCPVHSLDPGRFMAEHELRLVEQLFAGLAEVDAELNVVPHAARSWEVLEEGRCFRIYLRDDVRWTDGSPVSAHDYAYAWLRILDPRLTENDYVGHLLEDVAGARAYRLGQLSDPAQVGIRALDERTLEVRLEQPLPYFPYLLALPITYPLPRRVVERWGDAWWQPEHTVSNGPFRLAYLEREHVVPPPPALYSHVVLEHNPLYFGGGSGNLARVEYVAIRDEAERLARFRSGELDQARCWEVPEELAAFCQDSQELSTRWWILLPRPPLDDVRVRRAIAMAVDWGGLAGRRGTSPVMGGLVPPGMPGHTPGLALPHNLAQARRLLAEAGYAEGRGLPPLRIQCVMRDVGAAAAQLLAEALHVDIDFRRVSPATVLEDASTSQLIFQGWQADLPDPDNFLRQSDTLHILHLAGWQDPELEALLERAAHTTDRAGRMALYREADRQLVVEQALVVPIAYAGSGDLSHPWVHGARPDRMGHLSLKDVVVEKRADA